MAISSSQRKKFLRDDLAAQRNALDITVRTEQSRAICTKLKSFVHEIKPKGVHTFLPMGTEVNIYPFLEHLLASNIPVFAPETKPKGILVHRRLHSLKAIEQGVYGTTHPTGDVISQPNVDICIVPGLGFSKEGARLGYGGGYYDRYLSSLKNVHTIGVCFDFQVINEIPAEPHDVKVRHVFSYI